MGYCKILALTYGPGPDAPRSYGPGPAAAGPLIIWNNILSQICPRNIIWIYTAPGAYLLHAPEAVCISNIVLEHIWLGIFFQIINGPGPCHMVQKQLVLDHKSRPISGKKKKKKKKRREAPNGLGPETNPLAGVQEGAPRSPARL